MPAGALSRRNDGLAGRPDAGAAAQGLAVSPRAGGEGDRQQGAGVARRMRLAAEIWRRSLVELRVDCGGAVLVLVLERLGQHQH